MLWKRNKTESSEAEPKGPGPVRAFLRKWRKPLVFAGVPIVLWLLFYLFGERGLEWYTGIRNEPLTYDTVQNLTPDQFEALADSLVKDARSAAAAKMVASEKDPVVRQERERLLMASASFRGERDYYPHIEYFRRAGIRSYKGPETCLKCHETMKVRHDDGTVHSVDTMADVMDTSHFRFQQTAAGFSTVGYDGRIVNGPGTRPVPVGKIDRACGIPGSFSWTGWASLVKSKPAHAKGQIVMRSEGCGQCHIGGNYHPATEMMLPGFKVPQVARQGIDCLICHSDRYDMNYKYVIKDKVGTRWNQDRTMKAALTVLRPSSKMCLRCHQHNMGGDTYMHNVAAKSLGYANARILHPGAKRGNAFSPVDDVHSRAGMSCLDCHRPMGHKIPRGTLGTDLVSNDLPNRPVTCESCHTTAPHTRNPLTRVILNGHGARVACETCHIKQLQPYSVVLRDWVNPTWDEHEGIYLFTDIYHNGQPGKGLQYLWFNGYGTFLANALGDNPLGGTSYNPLMNQLTRLSQPGLKRQLEQENAAFFKRTGIDPNTYLTAPLDTLSQLSPEMRRKRAAMIEKNIRPTMRKQPSKIYPFKMFNAYMYEDMANQGPFGAMILPFDYPTYFETGNTRKAMEVAIANPIVKRMYEAPFKAYMMDEFMKYFGVDEWKTAYPLDPQNRKNVQPRWMRQMGTLMVNHGIEKEGHKCEACHSPNGIMDFKALGYSPAKVYDLTHLRELKWVEQGRTRQASAR
jgi:hypothetical protein